jgi:single-stranded DNA-specific DHH superfamily exonuclease
VTIDRETLRQLIGADDRLDAALDVIEPYLPALKRMGKAGVDVFLDAIRQQDWQRIDRALYEKMTESERDALSDAVLQSARDAVKQAYQTNRLWQEDLLRLAIGLLLSTV